MVAHSQFNASTTDIHEQAQGRLKLESAQNTKTDKPRFVLFGQHFEADPKCGNFIDKGRTVGSFSECAGGHGPYGSDGVPFCRTLESPERFQCFVAAFGIKSTRFENFMAKPCGTPILFDNAVRPRLVNRCDLEPDRVASGINDSKGGWHLSATIHA